MHMVVKLLLVVGIAASAPACGGSDSDGGSSEPVLEIYTPFLPSNEVWSRTELDTSSDQATWNTLPLPTPPTGATSAILGIRGRARGWAGTARSRVSLNVRALGADEPAHHILRLNAQEDFIDVKQQTLCVVPLVDANGVEVWYQLELSGSERDQARASIFLQGWIGSCGPMHSPLDPDRELLSRAETGDLSDEDAWIDVPLVDAPSDAKAVLLNLNARAAGFGLEPSRVSLYARASGSTLEVGDLHSAISVTAQSAVVNRNRNCILVPLAVQAGSVELRYRMLAGGSEGDQYRVHVYVQGYLTDACSLSSIVDPYQDELELLHRELGGGNPDEGSWQVLDLSSVAPEGTRGVLLGLAGAAMGRLADASTQVRLRIRKPGDPEPAYTCLALDAFGDTNEERGHNLILCPLSTARNLEYRYEFTPSGSLDDEASFGVFLQGVVGTP